MKFYEIPFNGSRVVPRGRTDRQTDITKLIVNMKTRLKLNLNISVFRHVIPKFRRKQLAPSAQDFYSENEGDMFRQYV